MNDMPGNTNYDELVRLAFAVCDGRATDAELDQVDEILTGDPAAALVYLECLDLHSDLEYRGRRFGLDRRIVERIEECEQDKQPATATADPDDEPIADAPPITRHPALHFPVLDLLPAGSVLLAYVSFLLMIAAGLLAAWVWNGPRAGSATVANGIAGPPGHRDPERAGPQANGVGEVTGIHDCRWTDPASAADDGDPVPLGRRYELTSGWLQIRYHTGAVVVVYGPAIYQADSATSGLLTKGKANVWVYERGERGRGEWQHANVSPYFFGIHTPKAAVYDICGHFSVNVDSQAGTHTHLIDGRIMAVYPRTAARAHDLLGGEGVVLCRSRQPSRVYHRVSQRPHALGALDGGRSPLRPVGRPGGSRQVAGETARSGRQAQTPGAELAKEPERARVGESFKIIRQRGSVSWIGRDRLLRGKCAPGPSIESAKGRGAFFAFVCFSTLM